MDLQTMHVAQLYQSVATFGVGVLLLAEIMALWKGISIHAQFARFQQQQQQIQWINQHMNRHNAKKISESFVPNHQSQQASAISNLRRQINEYENKAIQEGQARENLSPEVSPNPMITSGSNREKPQGQQVVQGQTQTKNIWNIGQLDKSLKGQLLFYIQYNNFIKQHVSIIFSVLVIGMLTNSTRIFSLACFFCYLFTSLTFDFLQLEEKLKKQYKRGIVIRRMIKILSGCLILGIFISYWCIGEYV